MDGPSAFPSWFPARSRHPTTPARSSEGARGSSGAAAAAGGGGGDCGGGGGDDAAAEAGGAAGRGTVRLRGPVASPTCSDAHSEEDEALLGVGWVVVRAPSLAVWSPTEASAIIPVIAVDMGEGLAQHLLSGDLVWVRRGTRPTCSFAQVALGDIAFPTEGVLGADVADALGRLDCTQRVRLGGGVVERVPRPGATSVVAIARAIQYLEEQGQRDAAAALREITGDGSGGALFASDEEEGEGARGAASRAAPTRATAAPRRCACSRMRRGSPRRR